MSRARDLADSADKDIVGTLTVDGLDVAGNIVVTGTVDGRDVATDGTKLNGIESNATADQTASEILTALLTVDGTGTTLDADLLDGQHGSYYTTYADTAITNLVDSSPAALNTLNELAAALGDDANFSTTVTNSIATKLPLAGGTLSGALDVNATVTADENITIDTSSSGNGLTIQSSGNTYNRLTLDANRTGAGNLLGEIMGEWNGNQVGAIRISAGSDTTNKDDGKLSFLTSSDGTGIVERMSIDSAGNADFTGTVTTDGLTVENNDALITLSGTRGTDTSHTISTGGANSQNVIIATGSTSGNGLYYRSGSHNFQSQDGTASFATVSSTGLTVESATTTLVTLSNTDGSATAGQEVGRINFTGADVSTNANGVRAAIYAEYRGVGGGTELNFQTANESATPAVDRISISRGGDITFYEDTGSSGKFRWDATNERLGIGTTAPAEMLEIYNATSPAIQLNDGGDYKSIVRLAGNDLEIRGSSGAMEFYTGAADGDSSTQRMTISSSGATTFASIVGINKAPTSTVGLSVGSDAAASNSYGLEVCNNNSNTRFLVDGLGNSTFYGSDNSFTGRFTSDGNLSLGTTAPMQDFGDGRTTLALKGTGSQDYAVIQMGNKGTASNGQLHGQIAFYDVHSGSDLRVSRISSYREISTNSSYLTFGTSPGSAGTTDQMRLDRAGNLIIGNVGIWSTTGNVTLIESNGTINTGKSAVTSQRHNGFYNANGEVGSIRTLNSATSYNTSSDYRLKENVVGLTGATDRVKALKPSRFNFIVDPDATVDGFLAHEAQAVVPEAVHGTKDAMMDEEYEVTPAVLDEDGTEITPAVMGTRSVPDMQGIDQSKLVPLLTAALQEALTRIETLETSNLNLVSRIETLEAN